MSPHWWPHQLLAINVCCQGLKFKHTFDTRLGQNRTIPRWPYFHTSWNLPWHMSWRPNIVICVFFFMWKGPPNPSSASFLLVTSALVAPHIGCTLFPNQWRDSFAHDMVIMIYDLEDTRSISWSGWITMVRRSFGSMLYLMLWYQGSGRTSG